MKWRDVSEIVGLGLVSYGMGVEYGWPIAAITVGCFVLAVSLIGRMRANK